MYQQWYRGFESLPLRWKKHVETLENTLVLGFPCFCRKAYFVPAAAVERVLIERIAILPDTLWPDDRSLPSATIQPWLDEQHNYGLHLLLVRESALRAEPDLLADVGIYGDRAVGIQELDERSRTVRFTLSFDPQAVRLADDRWKRLSIFGIPYQDLLELPTLTD